MNLEDTGNIYEHLNNIFFSGSSGPISCGTNGPPIGGTNHLYLYKNILNKKEKLKYPYVYYYIEV